MQVKELQKMTPRIASKSGKNEDKELILESKVEYTEWE